jgi:hypothetical protein
VKTRSVDGKDQRLSAPSDDRDGRRVLPLPLAKCQTVEYTTVKEGRVFRNLRRALKAVAMKYRLPTQIILEKSSQVDLEAIADDVRKGDYPSEIAWDFFTAMCFKAGGFFVGTGGAHCWVMLSGRWVFPAHRQRQFASTEQPRSGFR